MISKHNKAKYRNRGSGLAACHPNLKTKSIGSGIFLASNWDEYLYTMCSPNSASELVDFG